jgi:4-hydroxy-2-oxoheptanedioate aldolase
MMGAPIDKEITMPSLREQWANGQPTFGGWLSVPSTVSAEGAARVGFEYVCVDLQHGAIDYQVAVGMLQAIALGPSSPVVRVPWNEPGIIGKVLDAGAEGVIVPMVNTRAEAEAVVRACRYAPVGARSHGPLMSSMRRPDYFTTDLTTIATIPMIETVEAVSNLDEILSVPGVDAIYVGPADLSVTLGLKPGNNDGEPLFDEALATIVAACRRHGVVPGMHSTGALAERRLEQGFMMLTVSGDMLAIRGRMGEDYAQAKGAKRPDASTAMY